MDNKCIALSPLTINLPDGKKVQSTHVCDINIPGLPMALMGHIVPSLTIWSLIWIRPLYKAGCKVIFDNENCNVVCKGKDILTGFKSCLLIYGHSPFQREGCGLRKCDYCKPPKCNMMLSHHLGHSDAPTTAMVPGELSPCMIQGTFKMVWPLPQPSPCIGCAPHPQQMESNIHSGINIAMFTHLVQTQANAVNFAHLLLFNPKISALLKVTQRASSNGAQI